MQYMLQIYSGDSMTRWEKLSEERAEGVMGEYRRSRRRPA